MTIDAAMRVAVTGPGGRLGTALVHELRTRGVQPILWGRPHYDLDVPGRARQLTSEDRPDLVIHCAAWVDVDGCAREPALARRRNADAVGELAGTLAARDIDLVLVSTNEVFSGQRTDGVGYTEADEPHPVNVYGQTKLEAERAAKGAYDGGNGRLWIVRTAWLFGKAGNDFPEKILRAADRAGDRPLRVVDDEIGTPTESKDLAVAIIDLPNLAPDIYHLVGRDRLTRHAWAADLLAEVRPDVEVQRISGAEFARASVPPEWGVLATTHAAAAPLRGWSECRAEVTARLRNAGS